MSLSPDDYSNSIGVAKAGHLALLVHLDQIVVVCGQWCGEDGMRLEMNADNGLLVSPAGQVYVVERCEDGDKCYLVDRPEEVWPGKEYTLDEKVRQDISGALYKEVVRIREAYLAQA